MAIDSEVISHLENYVYSVRNLISLIYIYLTCLHKPLNFSHSGDGVLHPEQRLGDH